MSEEQRAEGLGEGGGLGRRHKKDGETSSFSNFSSSWIFFSFFPFFLIISNIT